MQLSRELRDLTRYRRKLVESRSAERERLLNVLETANIKLASVVSDVFGASGLLMLQALAEGKDSAHEMAQLAKKQLRKRFPSWNWRWKQYFLSTRFDLLNRFPKYSMDTQG